jgi:hypothetical protein
MQSIGEYLESIKKPAQKVYRSGANRFAQKDAWRAVQRALTEGTIEVEPCCICRETEFTVAHHEDYNKPLDVHWLCVRCHHARHSSGELGQERMIRR